MSCFSFQRMVSFSHQPAHLLWTAHHLLRVSPCMLSIFWLLPSHSCRRLGDQVSGKREQKEYICSIWGSAFWIWFHILKCLVVCWCFLFEDLDQQFSVGVRICLLGRDAIFSKNRKGRFLFQTMETDNVCIYTCQPYLPRRHLAMSGELFVVNNWWGGAIGV